MIFGTENAPRGEAELHLRVAQQFLELTDQVGTLANVEAAALHVERALDLLRVVVARAHMEGGANAQADAR